MNMTNHAIKRSRQRGFSPYIIEQILEYGVATKVPGGATKVTLSNKAHQIAISELKKKIQLLDKAKGGHIVIAEEDIITLYKY